MGSTRVRSFVAVVSCVALVSCGGSPSAPSGAETITGSERFGWDQPAADAGEAASFRYAMYVDETRTEAADVSCAAGQTSGRFGCTSSLPSAVRRTSLQVAAFVIDAGPCASAPAIVRVVKR